MDFKDKVVLITGGAAGIGKIMVRKALERNAKCVIIWDINEEALFSKGETKETVSDVDITKNYSGAARLMSKYFK